MNRLGLIAAICLLGGALGAGLWLSDAGAPRAEAISCSVTVATCKFETPQGTATLDLSPRPLSSAKPFKVSLSYPGDASGGVWIDLQGKEMYMGVNQVNLISKGDQWLGEANLGLCTTGTMRWVLNLVIEGAQGQTIYQFEFDAG